MKATFAIVKRLLASNKISSSLWLLWCFVQLLPAMLF